MAHRPSPTGGQALDSIPFDARRGFHSHPQSTVVPDSSLFYTLISDPDFHPFGRVRQLNLVRDLLQRQVEQSQAAPDSRLASEAFTSSNLAIEEENHDAIMRLLAVELDSDFDPNQGFEWEDRARDREGRLVERQHQRLIALLEHERPTSTAPVTIHDTESNTSEVEFLSLNNFPGYPGELDLFDESDFIFEAYEDGAMSMNETRTPASRTVVRRLPSVVLREEDVEKNEEFCSICIEWMKIGEEVKQLPCSHRYHGGCIREWLEIRNTCPICRHELPQHPY